MTKLTLDIELNPKLNGSKVSSEAAKLRHDFDGLGDFDMPDFSALEAQLAAADAKAAEFEAQLARLEKQLGDVEKEGSKGSDIFEKMFAFESIGKAAEFLDGFSEKGAELVRTNQKLAASTGLVGAELDALKGRADAAFVQGLGENLADAREKMGQAQGALKGVLNPQEIQEFAVGLQGLGPVMDKEFNEVLQKAQPLITNFKVSGKEAFNILSDGAQHAKTPADDYLDTLGEYSGLLKQAGFDANEFNEILIRGSEAGSFSTDKIADAAKESQIRLKAGDTSTALAAIQGPVSETIQSIVQLGEQGQLSVKEVLQKSSQAIETAFDAGQISESMRSKLQVAVSGTPAEDLGTELYAKIFTAPIDKNAVEARARQAGKTVRDSIGPMNFFEGVGKDIEAFTSKTSEVFAPVISGAGGVLTTITQIGPGLAILQDKFHVFDIAGGFIKKLIPNILGMIPALAGEAVATEGAEVAQAGLNLTMLANPAFLLVAGVGALVAAFLIFGDSTKEIGDAIDDVNKKMEDFNAAQAEAQQVKATGDNLRSLADEYDRLKDKTDPESQKRFAQVAAELADSVPEASETVEVLGDKGEIVGDKFSIATDEVRKFALENQKIADDEAAAQLQALGDEAAALVDSYHESTLKLEEEKQKQKELNAGVDQHSLLQKVVGTELLEHLNLIDDQREAQVSANKEVAEESKKRSDARKKIDESINLLVKQGKSQAQIKELLHLSDADAKAFAGSLSKAGGSAQAAAAATTGLQAAAARAKTSVADLAAAYDKVRSSADAAYSNTFKAVLALKQEQRSASLELQRLKKQETQASTDGTIAGLTEEQRQRKIFLEQRIKDLPGEITQEIEAAKQTLKDKKALDLEETKLKLQVGEIDLNVTDLTAQARDIRREIGDIFFDIANGNVEDEVKQATDKIDNDLAGNILKIKDQITAVQKQVSDASGDPTKAIKGADKLISALKAKEVALEKQAAAEKVRVEKEIREKQLEEFKKLLAQEQALQDAAIDARIAQLEAEETAITDVSDDGLTDRLQKRAQIINLQAAQELAGVVNTNEAYLKAYAELQVALHAIDEAKDAAARETALKHAEELRASLGLIEKQVIEGDPKAIAIQLKRQQDLDKASAEILNARYERELKQLEEKQAKEQSARQRAADAEKQLLEDMARFTEELGNAAIDSTTGRKLRQLQDLRDQELIGEQDFEAQKAALEKRSAEEAEELQARVRGVRIEGERLAAVEQLNIQRDLLEQKKALAEQSGKTEEASALGKQLDDLQGEIDTKGKALSGLAGEIQSDITNVFTNLFAGDEAAVKQPFKKAFNALAGGLQQLASAKIAEVLLSSIGPTGLGGLLATFLLKPLISSLVATVMSPIFNGLLAFPTGVRVDEPTLGIIGDSSRLGGPIDREWVLGDEHMRLIINEVLGRFGGPMAGVLRDILGALQGLDGRFYVLQSDVSRARGQSKAAVRRRYSGRG